MMITLTVTIPRDTLPAWVRWIAFDVSGALYCYARKPTWNRQDHVYEPHPDDHHNAAILVVNADTVMFANARATLTQVRKL